MSRFAADFSDVILIVLGLLVWWYGVRFTCALHRVISTIKRHNCLLTKAHSVATV